MMYEDSGLVFKTDDVSRAIEGKLNQREASLLQASSYRKHNLELRRTNDHAFMHTMMQCCPSSCDVTT